MSIKVGDKVKILPSAVVCGIPEEEIGVIGRIAGQSPRTGNYEVVTDYYGDEKRDSEFPWYIGKEHLELIPPTKPED